MMDAQGAPVTLEWFRINVISVCWPDAIRALIVPAPRDTTLLYQHDSAFRSCS